MVIGLITNSLSLGLKMWKNWKCQLQSPLGRGKGPLRVTRGGAHSKFNPGHDFKEFAQKYSKLSVLRPIL